VDLSGLVAAGAATQGLLTPQLVKAAGLRREWLSRGARLGELHRVRRRVYSFTPLPALPRFVVTHDGVAAAYVTHVRAVLLSLGPGAAARGRTAAALRGWGLLVEPGRTVEVVVPHGLHPQTDPDVRCTQARDVEVGALAPVAGAAIALTTAVRTVIDCALELPLLQAVVICDSALRAGAVSLEELAARAKALPGREGASRVRRMIELADKESGSVLESVLRVRLLLAGVTGFATQAVLLNRRGGYLRRVDFCFSQAALVIEVDGHKWHPDPVLDRRVDNQLAAAGWRVMRYTWTDVLRRPAIVVAEIEEALRPGTPDLHLSLLAALAAA
jgi:very-short-patch-repair endonuclease